MIKTLNKQGIEGNFLNKGHYEKLTPNIILSGERLKVFPQSQKQDVFSCHFYSTLCWKLQPWQLDKKETKGIQIWKKEVKITTFTNDILFLYVENIKELSPKLLELFNDFSGVSGYWSSWYPSSSGYWSTGKNQIFVFLYTSKEQC